MKRAELLRARYPEAAIGGHSRFDGTVEFYGRIDAILEPSWTVLDFGAGAGDAARDESVYRRRLTRLRGRVARVVGVDIEPAVLANPLLDEAHQVEDGGRLPFDAAAFDLVVADWVFEHLRDPAAAIGEIDRVLRPGGWLCARTTNRRSYVAVGARLIPRGLHALALRHLQPWRAPESVFRAHYLLNTRDALRDAFPDARYHLVVYPYDAEPAYAGSSRLLWQATSLVQRIAPARFATTLFIFARKRA